MTQRLREVMLERIGIEASSRELMKLAIAAKVPLELIQEIRNGFIPESDQVVRVALALGLTVQEAQEVAEIERRAAQLEKP